ncbi:MAG TPA: hypothetical protein VI815_01740 [Candidatus Nanoarchaeia archaeon]|nr:hypothetical protein [Candidatus Nanoarchaeia archaeon]
MTTLRVRIKREQGVLEVTLVETKARETGHIAINKCRGINILYSLDEKGRVVTRNGERAYEFSTSMYSEKITQDDATMRVGNIFEEFFSAIRLYEDAVAQGNRRADGFRRQISQFEDILYGYIHKK